MYLNFKDFLLIILKAAILTSIIAFFIVIGVYNYNLGVNYCNLINIPTDFSLTVMSPGMAIDVAVIMFVVEITILYFVTKNLKKIKIFSIFFDFISLDY